MEDFLNDIGTKDIKSFAPNSLSESEEIINFLKFNPLILNTSKLKASQKQRFLDLMTGAICALDKHVCVLDNNNYLFLSK